MQIRKGSVVLALLLGGCVIARTDFPVLPANSGRVSIEGASFVAPTGYTWYEQEYTQYEVVLSRLETDKLQTVIVRESLYRVPDAVQGKDFIEQVKEDDNMDTDPKRFKRTVHDVMPAQVGLVECARTHTVTEDHAPASRAGPMILETLSLNCRHPDSSIVGVYFAYSERHVQGGGEGNFMQKATAFLDSVQLTKP